MKSTKAAQNGNIVFLNSVVWYTASGGLKSTEIMLDEVEKSIRKVKYIKWICYNSRMMKIEKNK